MDEKEKWLINACHPIENLYVYISQDEDGGESVMLLTGRAGVFPLIASDMDRAISLRSIAETVAERYGKKIRLCKFSNRKDITERHLPGLKNRGGYEK